MEVAVKKSLWMEVAQRRLYAFIHAEDMLNEGMGTGTREKATTAANRILAVQPGGMTRSNIVTRRIAKEYIPGDENADCAAGRMKAGKHLRQDKHPKSKE